MFNEPKTQNFDFGTSNMFCDWKIWFGHCWFISGLNLLRHEWKAGNLNSSSYGGPSPRHSIRPRAQPKGWFGRKILPKLPDFSYFELREKFKCIEHMGIREVQKFGPNLLSKILKMSQNFSLPESSRLTFWSGPNLIYDPSQFWGFPTLEPVKCSDKAMLLLWFIRIEPQHDKTKKMTCAPSKDSDQPGHPPCLIRVSAVCSVGS